MTRMRRSAAGVLAFHFLLLLACVDGEHPMANTESALHAALTADAKSQLDAHGKFVLASAGTGEISESDAKRLAMAWWRSTVGFVTPVVERDRGAEVHEDDLEACPRAYLALSAYEPSSAGLDPLIQRMTGSRWLVGLCYGNVQEVLVAVSALAGDARERDGRIEDPGLHNFFVFGVPVGSRVPFSPEDAAIAAAVHAGARVAAPPRLLLRTRPYSAANAVWDIELENEVLLRGVSGSSPRRASSVLVGHFQGWREPSIGMRSEDRGPADRRETVRLAAMQRAKRAERAVALTRAPEFVSVVDRVRKEK